MSFIKVQLGGRARGLRFDQLAWTVFLKNIDYAEVAATSNTAMVYAGLYAECYRNEAERDFTRADVQDWLDDVSVEDLDKIADKFRETTQWQKMQTDKEPDMTKKKPKPTKQKV
jgi:hypothetical protein